MNHAMKIVMKLVTANEPSLFEERMTRVLAGLTERDVIVDVEFDTSPTDTGSGTVYSALVHVQTSEPWS